MKTDVIEITNKGEGVENALTETERAAVYRGLTPKQTLRLRLLAEEMTGMLRSPKPISFFTRASKASPRIS